MIRFLFSLFLLNLVLFARLLADGPPLPDGLITTPSGLQYVIVGHGAGALAKPGEIVVYHYQGTLPDGTVFDRTADRNAPFAFTLGKKQVIKGVEEAFAYFRVGDKGTIVIPPKLAYGEVQRGPIPPNSTLRFDIEVMDIKAHGLADLIQEAIDSDGVPAAGKRFAELQAEKFGDAYVSESQLNLLGYRYLSKNNLPAALAVLQWNAELFPRSGNVYDSLAEANVKNGDRAAALANYTKSLELDPKNKNAEKFLAEIKATPDEPGALVRMQARMQVDGAMDAAFEAADRQIFDVPALKAVVTAFLDRYPDEPESARMVGNFFYYAESADLKVAQAEWAAFAHHPNAKIREVAAQKQALADLIKLPIELKFTAADGREVDVAALRGKVVLIDFWATWCGPCVQEIPNVVGVYGQYHPRGFEIVGISFDQAPDATNPARRQKTAEEVLAFTKEKGMPWPQYYDGTDWQNPLGKKYGIRGIPAMFLLDKRGMVVSTNARGPKLAAEVNRLLAE